MRRRKSATFALAVLQRRRPAAHGIRESGHGSRRALGEPRIGVEHVVGGSARNARNKRDKGSHAGCGRGAR